MSKKTGASSFNIERNTLKIVDKMEFKTHISKGHIVLFREDGSNVGIHGLTQELHENKFSDEPRNNRNLWRESDSKEIFNLVNYIVQERQGEEFVFPSNDSDVYENTKGLTLRDYFAAKVMTSNQIGFDEESIKNQAKISYLMADAMIVARKNK